MIYLVEDDSSIRELIVYTLNRSGFEAVGFEKPSEFLAAFSPENAELVILDIMLPEYDGLTLLKELRENALCADIPAMMLTAKSSEYDKVLGLDSGADDYLTKPFGMMELVARIRALIRRAAKNASDDNKTYTFGEMKICPSKLSVSARGKEITLTHKEFEILTLFIENPGTVFTRDKLLSLVWGYDFNGESRTVDMHIKTLRQKLGDCGKYIETIRGVGYRLWENTND